MRTSVAVASLAIVALAILVPSTSGVYVQSVTPVTSLSQSEKNAASTSNANTNEANKVEEIYTDGNLKYASGSANTATSQDKDSAQSSVKELNVQGADGSSYRAKSASVKTASLDADTKTSNSYVSYKLG